MNHLPTIKQLQYLVALRQHGHFGRAAEACFVTQSTLSAGLRELENLLGIVLVERTRRVVRFTPLGGKIAEKAVKVLREAEELTDMARAEGKPLHGELRLGVIPTIAPFLLPAILLVGAFAEMALTPRVELAGNKTVYYTHQVTADEGRRLGEGLFRAGVFVGTEPQEARLDRDGDTWVVTIEAPFARPEGRLREEWQSNANRLSRETFHGQPVRIRLRDRTGEPRLTVESDPDGEVP